VEASKAFLGRAHTQKKTLFKNEILVATKWEVMISCDIYRLGISANRSVPWLLVTNVKISRFSVPISLGLLTLSKP